MIPLPVTAVLARAEIVAMKHVSRTRLVHAMIEQGRGEGAAIERALASSSDRHKGVHEARKAIRRLRALLSFGRKIFGAQGEALDGKLRSLGRGLSRLRDAEVAVGTVHTLARRAHDDDKLRWRELEQVLAARRAALMDQALAADPAFERRRRRVAALCKALEALAWDALEEKTVAAELERSRKRVSRARERASAQPTPANAHRWRRKVRRLRMQLAVLEALRENKIRIHGVHHEHSLLKQQATLADALGWKQDLQVLGSILRRTEGLPHREHMLGLLRAARRQAGSVQM
jgi:CHAD domain-containing protein